MQADRFPLRALKGFSALQRAEIAEMAPGIRRHAATARFSALQRAEIAEMWRG